MESCLEEGAPGEAHGAFSGGQMTPNEAPARQAAPDGQTPGSLREPARRCGDPQGAVSFPAAPGPWRRVVKIVIGARGQGASLFPARRGDALLPSDADSAPLPPTPPPPFPLPPRIPSTRLESEYLMLLIENDFFLDAHQRSWHWEHFYRPNNTYHEFMKGRIKLKGNMKKMHGFHSVSPVNKLQT